MRILTLTPKCVLLICGRTRGSHSKQLRAHRTCTITVLRRNNYFYPHVGVGGGAGGMKTFKWRDTTPMKFTLTTLSHTTNNSSNDGQVGNRVIQPVGSSWSRVKAKARELQLIGDPINRTEQPNSIFPLVKQSNQEYTPLEKALLCNSLNSKTNSLTKSFGKNGK